MEGSSGPPPEVGDYRIEQYLATVSEAGLLELNPSSAAFLGVQP